MTRVFPREYVRFSRCGAFSLWYCFIVFSGFVNILCYFSKRAGCCARFWNIVRALDGGQTPCGLKTCSWLPCFQKTVWNNQYCSELCNLKLFALKLSTVRYFLPTVTCIDWLCLYWRSKNVQIFRIILEHISVSNLLLAAQSFRPISATNCSKFSIHYLL